MKSWIQKAKMRISRMTDMTMLPAPPADMWSVERVATRGSTPMKKPFQRQRSFEANLRARSLRQKDPAILISTVSARKIITQMNSPDRFRKALLTKPAWANISGVSAVIQPDMLWRIAPMISILELRAPLKKSSSWCFLSGHRPSKSRLSEKMIQGRKASERLKIAPSRMRLRSRGRMTLSVPRVPSMTPVDEQEVSVVVVVVVLLLQVELLVAAARERRRARRQSVRSCMGIEIQWKSE